MPHAARWGAAGVLFAIVSLIPASALEASLRPTPPPLKSVKLTLLYTNDTHGHLLPYSYPERFDAKSPLAKLKVRRNIGGIARRATLIRRIRADQRRAVVVIDAGDICDGTAFSTEYHGDADVAAMNAAGYDLACPGNHEFNNSLAQVRRLIAEARYPILSANTAVGATRQSLYRPYVVRTIRGVRVAFFGLLTTDTRNYRAAKEGIVIEDPFAAARRLVPQLRRRADLVIAVTHLGYEVDRRLAREVPGIDVIVGGHSHTLLDGPVFVASTQPGYTRGTLIVQDFQWAGTLGELDLALVRDAAGGWRIQRSFGKLIPVTSSVPEDPHVAKVVAAYWRPIAHKYGRVVGNAADDFAETEHDDANYHLVADAVREAVGSDFDLENIGGVRANLAKGPITYEDVVELDPFSNTIVTFDITGSELKEILARTRPAVSGIRYKVRGHTLLEASVAGEPIRDERIYHGSTNSYMAAWPEFQKVANRKDTGIRRLDAILRYLERHNPAVPQYDGRRTLVNTRDFDP
ncbi:MAG: bifunctional metallophosphatase/5'-nucleotidase [Chthonomonadales bacterium]